jgi:steroid 5-alpha reductase family enzyme
MNLYVQSLITVVALFSVVFLLALKLKNNGIADSFWGLGFIVIGLNCLRNVLHMLNTTDLNWENRLPFFVILYLVIVWGTRLSTHIIRRSLSRPEDFRYAKWRKSWGQWFVLRSYLQIFVLQAVLCWVISLPLQFTAQHENAGMLEVVSAGLALWIFGFLFEVVGDLQLHRFISNPENKGKIMMRGLWSRTRHPNYFGEACMWWGIFIIALSSRPPDLWIIASPILITFLLRFVSGVPLLEKKYEGNKAYLAYQETVPPMFPKLFS